MPAALPLSYRRHVGGDSNPEPAGPFRDDNRSSSARPDRKWSVETPAESGQDTPRRRAAGPPPAAHTRGTAIEIEPDPTSPVQTRTPTRCESFARPQPTSGFRLPRQDPRLLQPWEPPGGNQEALKNYALRVQVVSIRAVAPAGPPVRIASHRCPRTGPSSHPCSFPAPPALPCGAVDELAGRSAVRRERPFVA